MRIQDLILLSKDICLNKLDVKSFYVGNTYDHSATKGDIYPCLWFETPILVEYQTINKLTKVFTFSLDFITLAKSDDIEDEMQQISSMEILSDLFLYWLKRDPDFKLMDLPTGLTVKSINADGAVGIRLDVKVYSNRECLQT